MTRQILTPPQSLTRLEQERLEQVEGIIFDIQRYSLHDGPGLRTNVFLKGCPLRCGWCANPESQQLQPELALFAHNCITCGQFPEACPPGWGSHTQNGWTADLRQKYGQRVEVCPTEAMREIGQRRTAGEIMAQVRRDAPFYEDGGGMTVTGGEPTMQPCLTEALLRLAKADYISTAIETCGHTTWAVWERLLPYLDTILFDLKHTDSAIHHAFTGVGNELILANLRQLAELEAPVTVRVPLIPGFNADPASVSPIAEFVKELGLNRLDLLPYHTLGRAKYEALGREYLWAEQPRLAEAEVDRLAELVGSVGLEVSVGG
ncbi:MAG: glycyl-radical enzyme activating protein [Chloroflexota bacterium]|nr:MAG: glycyl-radical enzyme activating protein [Chloroflexota bacterium]